MNQPSIQIKRLEKQILRILNSTLVAEVNDQLLASVTFTAVKLSNDKSWAKVYVDFSDTAIKELVIGKLNQIAGLFRNTLAQKLTIYKVPELKFLKDEVLEQAAKIEALINEDLKKIKQ